VNQQGSVEDRKCVRVSVPPALFLEAAMWVRPWQTPTHATLQELGAPDLRFAAATGALRIDDLSANGLRITLGPAQSLNDKRELFLSGVCLVYFYLKLAQPLSIEEDRPLSLLLGVVPVTTREEDGRLVATLNILYRGQPDRNEKGLTFFYVAKHPIRELASWCDEVTLMDRRPLRAAARGVRMNRFLLEVDSALAQATSPRPSATPGEEA